RGKIGKGGGTGLTARSVEAARGVKLSCDPLSRRLRGEAVDGLFLAVVEVEDQEELADRQQVLEPLGQAHELDLAAVVFSCHRGGHERSETGAVHIGDAAQV